MIQMEMSGKKYSEQKVSVAGLEDEETSGNEKRVGV